MTEFLDRYHCLFGGLRLGYDANIIFHGENLCDACAEDCLIVSENNFQHLFTSDFVITQEFIALNHTGDAGSPEFLIFIAANHATVAMEAHILSSCDGCGGNRDFKFDRRINLQAAINPEIHTGSADICRASRRNPLISQELQGQMHWKSPAHPNVFHVLLLQSSYSVHSSLDYVTKTRECDSADFRIASRESMIYQNGLRLDGNTNHLNGLPDTAGMQVNP
jgi:hypothetical protein